MVTNAQRLARTQSQVGDHSFGIYIGIESVGWRAPNFVSDVITPYKALGSNMPDYVTIKVGENGVEWYDQTFGAIRDAFRAAGMGCAPYVFARPGSWRADAAIAARVGKIAGVVILDCEEQFNAYPTQLNQLVMTVRQLAGPDVVIIVSGYGDPITAVPGWDFHCLQYADAYQPQWYLGYWDLYHTRDMQAAISWGDGQIAQRFQAAGLGMDYPIQPAMNVENVNQGDIGAIAHYMDAWQASVTVWEMRDIVPADFAAFRAGVGRDAHGTTPPPVSTPAPAPTPAPVPPVLHRTWKVKIGDTLSRIASVCYGNASRWPDIWHANRQVIGDNPNYIRVGEILAIP